MISFGNNDDNSAIVSKPHVKLSIEQSSCSAGDDAWQVHSDKGSLESYSDCNADDGTVKCEDAGTCAMGGSVEQLQKVGVDVVVLLPDLAHNLPLVSLKLRKRHIAQEILNSESFSREFAVVEQGTAEKLPTSCKRYLKSRQSNTILSSSKCVTIRCGKTVAASCEQCIVVPSKPSSSLDALNRSPNNVSSYSETAAARNNNVQIASHKRNTKPAPSTFELPSSDEFSAPMRGKKANGSRKRRFKPKPESLPDEPVAPKCQHKCTDSPVKPSQPESQLHLSLASNCSKTLKRSCRQHVKRRQCTLSPENIHESDPDGSTGSDEPLADVVMQKLGRMQMQEAGRETSNDVSACGDNDFSHGLPARKHPFCVTNFFNFRPTAGLFCGSLFSCSGEVRK